MFSMHICINKLLSDTLNRRVHVFKLPHCFRIQSCGQLFNCRCYGKTLATCDAEV